MALTAEEQAQLEALQAKANEEEPKPGAKMPTAAEIAAELAKINQPAPKPAEKKFIEQVDDELKKGHDNKALQQHQEQAIKFNTTLWPDLS